MMFDWQVWGAKFAPMPPLHHHCLRAQWSCNMSNPSPFIPSAGRLGLGNCTCAQEAVSTKRWKKMGSAVAYKTRGNPLSHTMKMLACG